MAKTMTEWYSDGYMDSNSIQFKIPEAFSKEIEEIGLDVEAELAVRLQGAKSLYGAGGEIIKTERNESFKRFNSFSSVRRLIKQGKIHVASLGNGFYCMNGSECEFKGVVQASNCNKECPNFIADEHSLPIWERRYKHYKRLLSEAKDKDESRETIAFLELERDTYRDAIEYVNFS